MCHMQQHSFVGQSGHCVDKPPPSWEGGLAGTEEPEMKAEPEALPDGQGNYSEARTHLVNIRCLLNSMCVLLEKYCAS